MTDSFERPGAPSDQVDNNEPTLINLPPGRLDPFDWSVAETIVWIATRDELAVRGAAGYLSAQAERLRDERRGSPGRTPAVESLLQTVLPLDVADHHVDCPLFLGQGRCVCAELGRPRYCRCPDPLNSSTSTCGCVRAAITSFFEAFRDALTVSGQRDGESGYAEVPIPSRVGAALNFVHPRGFRVLPHYEDLKVPIKEVKQRWPDGFVELPASSAPVSRQQVALDRLAGIPIVGRPPDNLVGLKLFCDRLEADLTFPGRAAEAKAIRGLFAPNLKGEVPQEKTIREWIGPHHKLIAAAPDRASGLGNAIVSALQTLEAKVCEKIDGHRR